MISLPNLIPASRQRARRNAAALRTWAKVNGGGLVVFAAAWGLLAGTRDQGSGALKAEVDQVSASIADAQADLKKVSAELAALTKQIGAVPDIRERPQWSVLLSALGGARGDSVALVSVDLSPAPVSRATPAKAGLPPKYQLRLGGLATDHRAATGFSLAVERTGLFTQVRLTDASAQTVANTPVVAFTIECVLEDGGEAR